MNKTLILLLLFLTSLTVASQNFTSKEQWEIINKRIDSISIVNENYNKINNQAIEQLLLTRSNLDSLEKENLFYRVKEDYYSSALSEQSTRFALIISGILALVALISFTAFRYEIKQIKKFTLKRINSQNKKLDVYKTELSSTQMTLHLTQGNLNTSIGQYYQAKNDYVNAFHFYIVAAKSHGLSSKLQLSLKKIKETDENAYAFTITNLNDANLCLLEIVAPEAVGQLKQIEATIKKDIDFIYAFDNENIKNEISNIRVLLNQTVEFPTD
ncbi:MULTISPECIES: hypothetical protein [Arenibacter]|uniref:hypothetical protein n=1 Tax=Arenibacter TaxID=178469 RepID=UPI0004DF432B|nr:MULTISPECIES: hypothetical protein [Arenibacter]GBF22568.1 hypothetical protein C21_04768 [Arenibacter sp. NBRC 103722]